MHRCPSSYKLLLAVPALLALACGSSNGDSLFAPSGSSAGGGAGGASSGGSTTGGAPSSAGSAGDAEGGAVAQGGGGVDAPSNGGSAGRSQGGTGGQGASGGSAGTGGGIPIAGAAGAPRGGSGGTGGGSAGGGGAACAPASEICDGLDNDCDAQIDERGCTSACSGFAIAGRGYMYCGSRLRAALAEQNYCATQGMHLAWIETAEENSALVEALIEVAGPAPSSGSEPGVSIGGTDLVSEGEWLWGALGAPFWEGGPDGEPVGRSFANWSEERPNNDGSLGGEDCAVLLLEDGVDGDAGEWNDVQCSNPHQFVCEQPH